MSQRPSFSGANLWLRTSSCSYITFFWEVGGRICAPATVKTLHSAKHTKNAKKTENPLHGSTSFAAVPSQGNSPDDRIGAKPSGPPIFDDRRETTG